MKTHSLSSTRGFTLIELLVVIGLIAILAGAIGLSIRDNNPATSLRSAQGLISSALSAARGQAALKQQYAKLIVQADNASPNFLRLIRVVTSADQATWTQAGGDILLPEGVYVVPSGSVTGLTPAGSGRRSTFLGSPAAVPGITTDSSSWLSSGVISSLGTVTASGNIVVASGRITGANLVTLDNYESLRGLTVSQYGIATQVDDAASFGN